MWKATEYPVNSIHAPVSLGAAQALALEGRVITGSDGRMWGAGMVEIIEGPEPFWVSSKTPLTHRQAETAGLAGSQVRSFHTQQSAWFVFRYLADKEQWVAKVMEPSVTEWQPSPSPIEYGPSLSWFVAWYQRPELVGREISIVLEEDLDELEDY